MKATTLFLALGSIVTAASNTAEVASINNEDWDYAVVGEPSFADDEGRSLLNRDFDCITIRMKGDDNANLNSVELKDMSTGEAIYERDDLTPGIVDSPRNPCVTAPAGNLLQLHINAPEKYSSTAFHALFVGTLRVDRVAGSQLTDEDYYFCFRLLNSDRHFELADCESATEAEESESGTTASPPPVLPSIEQTFESRMGCPPTQKKIKVEFEKDIYNENVWYVVKKGTNRKVLECDYAPNREYCLSQTVEACLPADDYEIVMHDGFGDGCPKFELSMENSEGEWKKLIGRCYRQETWRRHFHTKTISMTQREIEWLNAHNERRAKYYYTGNRIKSNGNDRYVPQAWDASLAAAATAYAEELLDGCGTNTMEHARNRNGQGENMAKNRGSPGSDYGSQYSPDGILNRFVEMEINQPFTKRFHLTQVLWEASGYVGCGDAFKEYRENGVLKHCHTQVCRYTAPGNCGVNEDNDLSKMMYSFDDLNCGGENRYPPNGMYAM